MLVLSTGIAGYAFYLVLVSDSAPRFLQERLTNGSLSVYAHFLGGGLALIFGALQMSTWLRSNFPAFHRWLGRGYLLMVLASGTGGLYMATVAQGGWVAMSGFGLLAIVWLGTGLAAYLTILQGNINAHRNWMMRNYSLTLGAVTLRIYLPLALGVMQLDFNIAYPIIAWMAWVPNLLIAEWLFVKRGRESSGHLSTEAVGNS